MFTRAFGLSGKQRLVAVGLSAAGLAAVVAVLAVMFLSLSTHTAFGSGSGGGGCYSTTGPVCTFKGHDAYADFSNVSADGCVYTDAYVAPYENLTSPSHVATQTVYVSIYEWNNCTGALVMGADNMDPNSWTPAFTGTVQFDTQTATVNGTATMYDYAGNQSFTTTINVSWKGYGPSGTFIDSQHYRSPGFIMTTHYTGTSQSAEASGTFTDESGANLASTPTLWGGLTNSSGGTVQIVHA